MAEPSALDVAASAALGFSKLQCDECAQTIMDALLAAGHGGQQFQIRGEGGRDYMVCLSYDGGQETITYNGRHTGIRVGDIIFDNLHPNGMPFDQWLKDFDAIGGCEVAATTKF